MILFLKHTIETSFDFSQFLMLFLKNSSERNNASNSFESVKIDTNVKALSKKL